MIAPMKSISKNTRWCSLFLLALAVSSLCTPAVAQRVVSVSTLPGKMRFDVDQFTLTPGEKVRLVFTNNDEMLHNLVVIRGDEATSLAVAQRAWAMGAAAAERQFVPDMPDHILHHTKVLEPGQQDSIDLVAPKVEGAYPYLCTLPGHAFSMKGIMLVKANPEPDKLVVKAVDKSEEGSAFVLQPHHHPIIKRAFVENGPPRSVMVGFPGGINFCFDAESCFVSFGWFGPFLDIGPDWGRNANQRGGGPVKVLGERFTTGAGRFPLRIGSKELTPQVHFKGYQVRGEQAPTFEYTVNGAWFMETIEPAEKGIGLKHTFKSDPGLVAPLHFYCDRSQYLVEASAGDWDGNWLTLGPEVATTFTLQIYQEP